mmetsp:Transcript_41256/g.62814  ORF Transcript_41256/g.62814 Transcript_41256/m.62814 type:complete len:182 (-) Transcript_41256:591-1136(-)
MQGLYKKVLRGMYPKIPSHFSNDLAQTIKCLVQVAPAMRPSCDKILDMPTVRKRIEKLFPNQVFDEAEPQLNLLSTIRVPKNLLYLTDRLPKPAYDSDERHRREQEELLRRRTYEAASSQPHATSQMLPELASNPGSHDRYNQKQSDKKSTGKQYDLSSNQESVDKPRHGQRSKGVIKKGS